MQDGLKRYKIAGFEGDDDDSGADMNGNLLELDLDAKDLAARAEEAAKVKAAKDKARDRR